MGRSEVWGADNCTPNHRLVVALEGEIPMYLNPRDLCHPRRSVQAREAVGEVLPSPPHGQAPDVQGSACFCTQLWRHVRLVGPSAGMCGLLCEAGSGLPGSLGIVLSGSVRLGIALPQRDQGRCRPPPRPSAAGGRPTIRGPRVPLLGCHHWREGHGGWPRGGQTSGTGPSEGTCPGSVRGARAHGP